MIMNLVRWTQYDENANVLKEADEEFDGSEFSYDEILNSEFGIMHMRGRVDIDLRYLYHALQKHKDLIFDERYDRVEMIIAMEEGFLSEAKIIGERRETQEDVEKRNLELKLKKEREIALKKKKEKDREERKLAELRSQIEKYKDKL